MPNTLSAKKRVRQNVKRRGLNRWRKRQVRSAIKDLNEKILHGTPEEMDAAFRDTQKTIDRTAAKGVFHKNTASRLKRRLSTRIKVRKAG